MDAETLPDRLNEIVSVDSGKPGDDEQQPDRQHISYPVRSLTPARLIRAELSFYNHLIRKTALWAGVAVQAVGSSVPWDPPATAVSPAESYSAGFPAAFPARYQEAIGLAAPRLEVLPVPPGAAARLAWEADCPEEAAARSELKRRRG